MRLLLLTIVAAAVATQASAAPILDGVRDGSYPLLSVQGVQTNFGDGNPNGGSELDAAWGYIDSGVLYLMLTGNLESNFNKLNIFIDSVPGGENVLTNNTGAGGNNPSNDGWAGKHAGFTFEAGFAADYLLILRNGNSGGDRFDIDYTVVGGGAGAFETSGPAFGASLQGANANALPGAGIGLAFNNSNVAGVTGGTGAADQVAAATVSTGIELGIPLSALGNPNPADIKISAMINGSNHDYLSNQFLGSLTAPQGNLGGDGAGTFNGTVGNIDLNDNAYAAGNQYFIITRIPEPTTLALVALTFAVAAGGSQRRARV
jgi:hypothetical protein